MSSIYNINKLSALFSEKTGHKSDASLSIIMELFHTVADGLKESGNVKIKGFGEFVVDAGQQVVFKPEEAIEDRINEPFSIFEPVEVEPELTAAMLDSEVEKDNEPEVEAPKEEVRIQPSVHETEPEETTVNTVAPSAVVSDAKIIEAKKQADETERLASEMKLRAEEAERKAAEAERKVEEAERRADEAERKAAEAQAEANDYRRQAAESMERAEKAAQQVKYVPVKTDSGRSVLMFLLGLCVGIILGGAAVYFIPFLMS